MSIDHVVDGTEYDADQPGHNPKLKPDLWPTTFAVHLSSRDGQSIPIGAVYQGIVDNQHIYALLTTQIPNPGAE